MALSKSVRFDELLERKVEKYLEKNHIRFAQLVSLAVESFISEPHIIELAPVNGKKWEQIITKANKKHKNPMDKLK